jgi:hypothetical protein
MSSRLPSQSTEDISLAASSERTKPSRESSSGAGSTFKLAPPPETFEVEDAEALPSSERTPWLREKGARYLRRHGRLARAVDYVQGPRPPISLPGKRYLVNLSRIVGVHVLYPQILFLFWIEIFVSNNSICLFD